MKLILFICKSVFHSVPAFSHITHRSISAIVDNSIENLPTHEAQTVADTCHQDLIDQQQADHCL